MKAYPALGPYSANWYHSLIDHGALIARWQRSGASREGFKLVLPAYWRYRWPALPSLFGLNATDYVWLGEGRVTCDMLRLPLGCRLTGRNSVGTWSFAHPDDIRNMRTQLVGALADGSRFRGKRVVIDRSDGWRGEVERVAGFNALKARLISAHGFEPVRLGQLSPIDQMSVYRDSAVVVAEHGAGLAGMICSSPDTSIVEIFPRSNQNMGIYGFSVIAKAIQNQRHLRIVGADRPHLPESLVQILDDRCAG